MPEEIDYLVCRNCDSPCYVFELDKRGQVESAFCQVCGADEPGDFRVPEADDRDGDS